jgi:glucosamine--fructose-6-phosphate aminotransferase (isomerizing)
MGSSYDACYPAVTHLAGAGIASHKVSSAELLYFRLPALGHPDTLILVSQSGESAETVKVAQRVRDRGDAAPRIVAVTNGTDNTLARLADIVVDTCAGPETGPSTMTFAASLVSLAAIARVRAGEHPQTVVDALGVDAEMAAAAIEVLLADTGLPDAIANWHGGRRHTVLLARGAARAAAEMGALTLKEAVGLPVEALEGAQFRHGPLELAGPDLAAVIIATEPATDPLDLALGEELDTLGSAVWTITADGLGAHRTAVGPLDPLVSAAAAIVPIQLLAWRLAVEAGREPGAFVHAAKVTLHG